MTPSSAVLLGAGAVALWLALKPLYERFVRRDVPVGPDTSPVLAKLRRPAHACHRGGSRLWPENTMLAFRHAVGRTATGGGGSGGGEAAGQATDVLEFDIQRTLDGHLVVMHDLSVAATTDGSGLVADLSLEQIRALDAGYRFTRDGGETFPYRSQGLVVPTVREVLSEFAAAPDLIFYLDFKAPDAVADTFQLVKEFGLEERIICGAIPTAANREVFRRKPACAPLTPDVNSMIQLYVAYCLGLLWLCPMRFEIVGTTAHRWGMKVLTKELVRAFHDRKRLMAVFGEYLDHEEGQLDCMALGCDLLVTDRPDILHTTLAKWRASTVGR